MKVKNLKTVLIGLIALTFLISCSEDDKNMDDLNPERKAELRSGNEQTNLAIFGNDYFVPFEAAQVIAQKIDRTLPSELKGNSESRAIQSSTTITDSLGMPNFSGNDEVQRLMVDVGCAVDMDYGCDGSGASQNKVSVGFKNDFDYSTAELDDWAPSSHNQVISDVNQNEPVILVGYNKRKKHKFIITWWTSYSEGHAWDCDGYIKTANYCYSTTKLHMNWGWWGSHNGWYHYNSWNPGSFNFQYAREYIHNIHP